MTRLLLCFAIAALAMFFVISQKGSSAPVKASPETIAYLIEFGLDANPDVDWSGSVTSNDIRLTGWQLDDGDAVSGTSWKLRTRRQTYWDTPYERRMQPTSNRDKVSPKGVFMEIAGNPISPVRITTAQGSFEIARTSRPGDAPRVFLGGRVRVSTVPVPTALSEGPDVEDFPSMIQARDGSLWLAYQTFTAGKGDQIYARCMSNEVWAEPQPLAAPGGDYHRTAIAQDATGKIWVVWSGREGTNFDLYARSFDGKKWSELERLTTAANTDMNPVLAADASGRVFLAWQGARSGNFDIYLRILEGGKWSKEIQVSSDPANDWEPALAAAPDGRMTILWDTYAGGNYDVVARTWKDGKLGAQSSIAATGAFETRVSAQYDRQGRLWAAWDQGDWNWGKDYGYEIPESGRGILSKRQLRVAVFSNGQLQETAAPIIDAVPEDARQVFHRPTLIFDGAGNPWVFFRTRVNLPRIGNGEEGVFRALWRLHATTLRDGHWSPVLELPRASGRIDLALGAASLRQGGIAAVWTTDGREWPGGQLHDQNLEFAMFPAGPPASPVELVAFAKSSENLPSSHPREARDVERLRAYRTTVGGQTFRIARGDIHRHTDLSWDGNRDGSLDDSYRYAMDAAAFDFLGVCDHQAGQLVPYNWWRLQKAVDLYTIPGRFAPLYSYERSLKWPNGHRNVFFGQRGRPVLEIGAAEASGTENTGKFIYPYLRQFSGLSSPHTSGSGAGTDFRDSDPEVEPLVEIYQGYRSNFETPGAPRSPTRKESTRFTAGFVQAAWAKGIKLGVQASSDHVSTHISYAGLYVDRLDRDALIAAMKARRTFAATDNIVVDLRMGDHFIGESFSSPTVLPLSVVVSGSQAIAQVSVIHNNRIVYSVPGSGSEAKFTWTDNESPRGKNYYYVRIEQTDGQLCWSSPIWVEYP
jgi:hypothetical protein